MKKPKHIFFIAVFIAIAQISILFFMIGKQAILLKNGREIILTIRPGDPRDFMRGDYVILSYDVLSSVRVKGNNDSSDIYVLLRSDSKNGWFYASSQSKPFFDLSSNEVQLHGQRKGNSYKFGIERFYVPEGRGKEIEKQLNSENNNNYDMVITISPSGKAVVKTLRYRGKSIFNVH